MSCTHSGPHRPRCHVRRPRPATRGALIGVLALLTAVLSSLLTGLPSSTAHALPQATSQLSTAVSARPPTQAAAQAPAAEVGTSDRAATVAITHLGPAVPDEEDILTIRGTVTNNSRTPIVDSSVAPRQPLPLTSRGAISSALARTTFDSQLDGAVLTDHQQAVGTLRPGMSRAFSLSVPVSDLSLGDTGVYQLAVTLTGQTRDSPWEQVLGFGRSLLPWQPAEQGAAQTQLTVLWPLISATHLTPRTGSNEEQTPTLRDDSLLAEISPGGRLHQMVTLGANLPVTWVIDPDLLASVDAMTEEYQTTTDQGLVNGDGQDEARAWLGLLKDAVQDADVVALPFGDPDLASLAHQGRNVPGALGQLKTATEMAGMTVETVLGVRADTDFAWPVEGAIDPAIVSVATSAGAHRIITRSDSLHADPALTYTPTAARPIGGGTTALVADAALSTLFQGDMTSGGKSSLAQQQLLAQTLSITLQAPSNERSVVLAPQRVPSTDQAQAMATALARLELAGTWVTFANLADAAEAEPDPHANHTIPASSAYPGRLRRQELPTSAFQAMRETQRTLEDFQVILTRADRVATPFGNAVRREMSTSWRDSPVAAAAYRTSVQDHLEGLTERVNLIQKSPITLSGRSATIPVTVQNSLVQDIHGLKLRLTSSRRLGLEVSEPQEVTITGGHSQSVKFSTTARANGRTFLTAQLHTLDGKPYGDPMRFQADVTSITSAVMMVIAGGLLLVVLAGIRMYTQRRRATGAAPGASVGESSADTTERSTSTPAESERLDRDQ